ncbi:MAG: D-aminoacyl-tRNA deacylase [Bacteriovoracia bacterium]
MKVVIQRVDAAKVSVDDEVTGEIRRGLVLFVCFEDGDLREILPRAAERIAKLRCFSDADGKMNLNVTQVEGAILSVSQFTLAWDGSGGHRPSFERSAHPADARLLWAEFNKLLRAQGLTVQEGRFGAEMKVELVNDGPVTFALNFP